MSFFPKSCGNCWDYPCTCSSKKNVCDDEILVKRAKIEGIIELFKQKVMAYDLYEEFEEIERNLQELLK